MSIGDFGTRLKKLRKQAGMSQRELAGKIGVDFSYLSKIESGALPPPSEKVILRLAEVLSADTDELMILAGKIPSDIVQILKNREALQLLRSSYAQKKSRPVAKEERISVMSNSVNYKRLSRIVLASFLVVAVAVSLWFASPVTDTAVAHNSKGIAYNEKGEHQKAMDAFTRAIELDPDFALAYSNRGWAYIELGQYEQAVVDSTKAIELDPGLAFAYNNRGWAYNELGQYEQAVVDSTKAIELDPGLAFAYSNRGWAYNGLGQYEQAVVDSTKAIELDSGLALAYNNRGWAYNGLGQYEQAVVDSTKAIELDPGLAFAYSNRGWAYIELGQYAQAITDYDKAIQLDPGLQNVTD